MSTAVDVKVAAIIHRRGHSHCVKIIIGTYINSSPTFNSGWVVQWLTRCSETFTNVSIQGKAPLQAMAKEAWIYTHPRERGGFQDSRSPGPRNSRQVVPCSDMLSLRIFNSSTSEGC